MTERKLRTLRLASLTATIPALIAFTLLEVGCEDDAAPANVPADGGAGGAADAPAQSDAVAPACPLARAALLRGKVSHLADNDTDLVPAADVRICVHRRDDLPCVVTAKDGTYEHLCLPEGEVGIAYSKPGYPSVLWLRVLSAGLGEPADALLPTDAQNVKLFGSAYPRAGRGLVTMNDTRDTDGITIAPVGATIDGPFYSGDGLSIDRDAGATFSQGLAFVVAPVGNLTLRLTHPEAGPCQQALGGWSSGPGTITVPVLENTETALFIRCK